VLVDPIRAERILGLAQGGSFSPKVAYIFRKQLEEADLLVITKSDLLDEPRLERLRAALRQQFPGKEVLAVSVRNGTGIDAWFEKITSSEQPERTTMLVDYEVYAEGEALLGWLNATLQLSGAQPFDTDTLLRDFASRVQRHLAAGGAEIAHLKMTLSPDGGLGDIAAINLVRTDFVPELSLRLEEPITSGQLIVNCRAEAAPETIRDAVTTAAAELPSIGVQARVDHLEYFRPGKPQPTHRDTVA